MSRYRYSLRMMLPLCIILSIIVGTRPVFAGLAGGSSCSANSDCSSNKCTGGFLTPQVCCGVGIDSLCAMCGNDGMCTTCMNSFAYYPSGLNCETIKATGATCSAYIECGTFCKTRCCKVGMDSNCTSCDSSGNCDACTTGYYPSSTDCLLVKGDGEACAADAECSNGACRNGFCCKSGVAAECTTCASGTGVCTACSGGLHVNNELQCLATKPGGETCSVNGDCTSNKCTSNYPNYFCCSSGVSSKCIMCDANGDCLHCSPPADYYASGTDCVAKQAAGGSCTADGHCQTGKCRGGKCCSSAIADDCGACSDSGICLSCSNSSKYAFGTFCLDKKNASSDCNSDNECLGGRCLDDRCCVDGVSSNCSVCQEVTGECGRCANGLFANNGTECLTTKDIGMLCSASSECTSGKCAGSFCCTAGMDSRCESCNYLGQCTACVTGYFPSGLTCLPVLAAGSACSSFNQCETGRCPGGFCCTAAADNGCASCNSSGLCVNCGRRGSFIASGYCKPKPAGIECGSGSECESTICSARCCTASVSQCTQCDAVGACASCAAGFVLNNGSCVVAATPAPPATTTAAPTLPATTNSKQTPTTANADTKTQQASPAPQPTVAATDSTPKPVADQPTTAQPPAATKPSDADQPSTTETPSTPSPVGAAQGEAPRSDDGTAQTRCNTGCAVGASIGGAIGVAAIGGLVAFRFLRRPATHEKDGGESASATDGDQDFGVHPNVSLGGTVESSTTHTEANTSGRSPYADHLTPTTSALDVEEVVIE